MINNFCHIVDDEDDDLDEADGKQIDNDDYVFPQAQFMTNVEQLESDR